MIYELRMTSGDAIYVDLDVEFRDVARLLDRLATLVGSRNPAALDPGGPEDELIEFVVFSPGQKVESISRPYYRTGV